MSCFECFKERTFPSFDISALPGPKDKGILGRLKFSKFAGDCQTFVGSFGWSQNIEKGTDVKLTSGWERIFASLYQKLSNWEVFLKSPSGGLVNGNPSQWRQIYQLIIHYSNLWIGKVAPPFAQLLILQTYGNIIW